MKKNVAKVLTGMALMFTAGAAYTDTINFHGPLEFVLEDNGDAVYSGVPIGSEFFGAIDDVTFSGFISDGTTSTQFNCCLDGYSSVFVDNNEILNASEAAMINSILGTSFEAGDFLDFINIGGEAFPSGESRIGFSLAYVLDSLAFDDESDDNYPPNPDDILITVFSIDESRSGLTITFDTFDDLGPDPIAIHVFVHGELVGRSFTNPFTDGRFVPVSVGFDADGTLDLTFDGSPIFGDLATGFTPESTNRFGFGGRTGGLNQVNRIDNVSISACRDTLGCPAGDAEYVNDFGVSVGPASLFGDAILDNGNVRLTDSINEQLGSLVINDLVPGGAVASFAATFDLAMGPGTNPPANGVSFNLGPLPDAAFEEFPEGETIYYAIGVVGGPLEILIDIKPGSDPNCFNSNGHGVIPVAILGSETFDVTIADQSSLLFGGLQVRVRGKKGPLCGLEYSNGDAYLDLVCHFEDDADSWDPGVGEATLTGTLFDGTEFEGTDSICIVP